MDNKMIATNKDIVFFKKNNGDTNIELLINAETLWVTQKTMAEIFDVQRPAITKHLKNIVTAGVLSTANATEMHSKAVLNLVQNVFLIFLQIEYIYHLS